MLRALLNGEPPPERLRYYPGAADLKLAPGPRREDGIPLWIRSWGSPAGLARVARAGDGWLASAYNTTPERFSAARTALSRALEERGRRADGFPTALATMWTWVSRDRAIRDGDPTPARPARGRREAFWMLRTNRRRPHVPCALG